MEKAEGGREAGEIFLKSDDASIRLPSAADGLDSKALAPSFQVQQPEIYLHCHRLTQS